MICSDALDNKPVIIGGGLAGLMTALHLAPEPVVVLSQAALGAETASAWAQGGIAAAIGADDSPALHQADTLAAGDGLCDAGIAARITHAAPDAIETLSRLGVRFDRDTSGAFRLGREAAHGRQRIVHAGDRTGQAMMQAVTAAVRAAPSVTVLEGCSARRLCVADGRIVGVLAEGPGGDAIPIRTGRVVIATGGIGGLFTHTTNPAGSWGYGLALAARAGAALRDLEFVQFHPTALDQDESPAPLLTEALRGAGAILIDETGRRFMADQPGAEMAARDIVTRAVWRHRQEGHRVFLDARAILESPGGQARFPGVMAIGQSIGLDPTRAPIPIRPAAHYHMGGVAVTDSGRSTVPGLWVCGESACTGLHGANRLASNSLLEAAICAAWVAADIAAAAVMRFPSIRFPSLPPPPDVQPVQSILSDAAGVWRDGVMLRNAAVRLGALIRAEGTEADPALVAAMIVLAALRREESRGAHARSDCPDHAPGPPHSSVMTIQDVGGIAPVCGG